MDDRPVVAAPPQQDAPRTTQPATPAASNGAPAPGQTSAEATRETEQKKDEGSVKETIEQILVAFILAFVFRAFVVEAFVIPTGSMAPTLLGAHMRFVCDDCGYQFDVNFNANPQGGDDMNIPSFAPGSQLAICPNCGYRIPNRNRGDQAFDPPVRYGDRILVLKYLYLFEDPKRWDVVVFKSPDAPQKFDYQQNYIKRLIGKPNESVMVLDGDIYVGERDAQPQQMKIQRKPREVQEALWRIIFDNDYHPRSQPRYAGQVWRQPWTRRGGGSGWNLGDDDPNARGDGGRTFRFDNASGAGEVFFNDELNQPMDVAPNRAGGGRYIKNSALFDWLAYDVEAGLPSGGWTPVGDLKLDFFYERTAGDGPLRVVLSKHDDIFVAEITPSSVRLLRQDGAGHESEVIPAAPVARKSGPVHVEFSNVDYCVTLRLDGVDVLKTNDQQYAPDIKALLEIHHNATPSSRPSIRIVAANQTATVKHLSLWRDIYYLSRGHRPGDGDFYAASPDNIMRLGPDEFFVMGDNSQISGDGRYWTEPIDLPWEDLHVPAGRVPARFMLGKAFFVYWPAGYRPMESLPALAPNFGDMRFIH
jgi:signal peptidase I